jgi:hypothetical protein
VLDLIVLVSCLVIKAVPTAVNVALLVLAACFAHGEEFPDYRG